MNTPQGQKSPREVAEAIAAIHGERPKVITVKMVGTKAVETFIKGVLDATANAHKGPPLKIRAAA